jgi:hypothetical protein
VFRGTSAPETGKKEAICVATEGFLAQTQLNFAFNRFELSDPEVGELKSAESAAINGDSERSESPLRR